MPREVGLNTEVGEITSERTVHDNKFFPVVERIIKTPEGTIRDPQLLWDRGGKRFAIALVTDQGGKLVLVKEPKYGQMRFMVSAPTGGVKKGESPLDAAKHEFLDETGYECDEWQELKMAPLLDFADKTDGGGHHIFVGRNAKKVREPKGEGQTVVLADISRFLDLVSEGRVPAMSIAAVLLARNLHYF